MSEFENWYISVNYEIDSSWGDDKAGAYDIYNWMLTDEGREQCFVLEGKSGERPLTKDDVIQIHKCRDYGEMKKRLAQQKAWNEMLKNGLAEK